jgi:hypothetical protein
MRKMITTLALVAAALLGAAGIASAHEEYPVKGLVVHADAVSDCTMFELTRLSDIRSWPAEDSAVVTERQLWIALQRCGVTIID